MHAPASGYRPLVIVFCLLSLAILMPVRRATAQSTQTWTPRTGLSAQIVGAGTGFPDPLYQEWIRTYRLTVPNVVIEYQRSDSGTGLTSFARSTVAFAGTDLIVPPGGLRPAVADGIYVPTALSAVVPSYNLPGITNLRFSPETLVGIYLGEIRFWNDGRIAADNPGVTLPAIDIHPVCRADVSGTTAIFTSYLSRVSVDWRRQVGSQPVVVWPNLVWPAGRRCLRETGDEGVSTQVSNTVGAIGYISLPHALRSNLELPAVQNAERTAFVRPSAETINAAASAASLATDLTGYVTFAPGANSYPLAGYTWVVLRKQSYTDLTRTQALTDFLYWSLTEGTGAVNRTPGYFPLPDGVRRAAITQLRGITVSGQQVFAGPVK